MIQYNGQFLFSPASPYGKRSPIVHFLAGFLFSWWVDLVYAALLLETFSVIFRVQLEDQREELTILYEGKLSQLSSELDERRLRELATVKEVLQREKENDLRELEAQLELGQADKLKKAHLDLEKQFQVREYS